MSKVFTITEGLENMGAIKSGGQGSVYKGRRVGEIITAIKLLPTPIFNPSEEDKHYRDFTNEVKKLQHVNEIPNPNIVKILSYGISETGGFPFIEMEYIDGPDLGELLKPPHQPVFTVKEIIKVADHLSHALAHCHRCNIKHGDIKSNNVKYNESTGNYVLLDFGLAILSDEERRTSMRHAGAIEFMAPEQNEGKMLFETDVYSFGIILYELLAGKVPFLLDGNSETARNKVMVAHMEASPPDALSLRAAALPIEWSDEKKSLEMQVPEWLLNLIYKCLQKKPEDRFDNGIELHDYISHHRIYTNEVAKLVHNEDSKWQAVVTEKDRELDQLRTQLAKRETEREPVYSAVSAERSSRNSVSRSAFTAVLLLLLLMSGLAVYGLFFRRSLVGGVRAENGLRPADSVNNLSSENNAAGYSKETPLPKPPAKNPGERRKQVRDSLARLAQLNEDRIADSLAKAQLQAAAKKEEAEEAEKRDEKKEDKDEAANKDNDDKEEKATGARYKVRSKAFFHDEPDASTRRAAFIVHWNNAVLKPLNEKDGFVYVVFTNHMGQTSRGWLSKDDLIPVK